MEVSLRRLLQVGIVLFIIVFLGLTAIPLSNRPLEILQVTQSLRSDFICIFGDSSVGQTFVSHAANLDGVEVYFGSILSENAPLLFRLQFEGLDIRNVSVNTSDLVYHDYNRFNFTRILDSADKNYSFVLESPDSTFKDPVCVSYIEDREVSSPTVYAEGYALLNGTRLPGDLTFRVTSETTLAEAFGDLYNRVSKDAPFFAFYFFILTVIVVVLAKVERSIRRERLLNKRIGRREER